MAMTSIPEGHVETVDELVDLMAKAISPHAFSDQSSNAERSFARSAAQRALLVCAPIILTEAALVLEGHGGCNAEAIEIVNGLKNLF